MEEPFLRSQCPGGAGCFCDGAEHVYVRDRSRTATPQRQIRRSSRRSSRTSEELEEAPLTTFSTLASQHAGTAAGAATVTASSSTTVTRTVRRSVRSTGSASRTHPPPRTECTDHMATINEYRAYSSDEEYEQFINQPKTDYTYARSVSYSMLSPQPVTPPNMSRRCIHTPNSGRLDTSLRNSYQQENITSRVVSHTSAAATVAAGSAAVCGGRGDIGTGDRGTTSATTPILPGPPLHEPSTPGSAYHLSGGLDADSGDEEWENNNVSKTSLSTAASKRHTTTERASGWVVVTLVRRVLSVLLYPVTAAATAVGGVAARLTAPAPATVGAAPLGRLQYRQWAQEQGRGLAAAPGRRRSLTDRLSSVKRTVTRTVSTVLWWAAAPVRVVASAGQELYNSAAAAGGSLRSAVGSAGRSLQYLSPVKWVGAAASAGGRAGTTLWTTVTTVGSTAAAVGSRVCALPAAAGGGTWNAATRAASSTWNTAARAVGGVWNTAACAAGGVWNTAARAAGGLWNTGAGAARSGWKATSGAVGWLRDGSASAVGGVSPSATGAAVADSPWRAATAVSGAPRRGVAGAAALLRERPTGRRLCLCLLPLLLLLLLLLTPLLWGVYCEADEVSTAEESAVLAGARSAPLAAWDAFKGAARHVGSSTVDAATGLYGYLALLGSSALVVPSRAPPPTVVVPAPPAAVVVPPVPAPPAQDALTAVHTQLAELEARLAAVQADFQMCRAASALTSDPALLRATLDLPASSALLMLERRLLARQQRLDGRLKRLLAAESGGRAALLTATETRISQMEEAADMREASAAATAAQLAQLQREFSDLHRTLLLVQDGLSQVRSCCNSSSPDWSALLSGRLRDLEHQLDSRLQLYAASIKDELASESAAAAAAVAGGAAVAAGAVSREEVVDIARREVALYDADKTGQFDYALESAGGSIISTRCTESYSIKSARISVFGVPLWYPSNNPRAVIQPSMSPGECFAFRGHGYFVVSLSRRIRPSQFVIEHIARSLTPGSDIASAPRDFTVLGLKDAGDQEGLVLGRYVYQESGAPLQQFPVQQLPPEVDADRVFSVVELRVTSNWGHPNYTCLYRFRVHGAPAELDTR